MLLPTIFRTEESLHRAWHKVPGNLEERLVRIGRLGDRKIHLKRIPDNQYCGIITEYSSYRRCCDEVWAGTYIKMILLPGVHTRSQLWHQMTSLSLNGKPGL